MHLLLIMQTGYFNIMEFHAEFFPKSFSAKIKHHHKLLLIGSCFTEQMGAKLAHHKFSILQNPNGILFNPVSILKSLERYNTGNPYTENDLFEYNGIWGSWDHHTRFSDVNRSIALENINNALEKAQGFLREADWVIITLGSAFVYDLMETDEASIYQHTVANCHKIPADKFNRRLLPTQEVEEVLAKMITIINQVSPSAKILFTISPVRHLREGFIENNRSKAALIQAVHKLVNETATFYFPAYELVIDDLRDYRFYAEDMAHPNYAATNYVWEKFALTVIDDGSKELMKSISGIMQARNHKPFNPQSAQHKKFLTANIEAIEKLIKSYPYLNFDDELAFFKKGLID